MRKDDRQGRGPYAWLPGALLLAWACSPVPVPTPPDRTGPWLLGMSPSGNAVPADAALAIRFSEPIRRDGVFLRVNGLDRPDGVALALESREGTLLEALDAPPLKDQVVSLLVACEVSISADRRTVTLRPTRALAPETAYVVVVSRVLRDDAGNRLVVAEDDPSNASVSVRFFTGRANDGQGPVARLLSPPERSTRVDPSVSSVVVAFEDAVDRGTVLLDSLVLVDVGNGTSKVAARLSWDDTSRQLSLGFDGAGGSCAPFCTSRRYALQVAPTVLGLDGHPAPPVDPAVSWFETAACFDSAPPRVAGNRVVVNANDLEATLTLKTDESGPSRVDLVEGDATLLGTACRTAGDTRCRRVEFPSTCPSGFDPCASAGPESAFACERRLTVDGLDPDTRYTARVLVRDPLGQGYTLSPVSFTTLAPIARPVITELFLAPTDPLDATAEFIELFNAGSGGVDLAGWRLARCPSNPCTTGLDQEWVLGAGESGAWLEPGAFALAAGTRLPAALLGVPAETLLLSGPTATLLSRGLRDAESDGYALLNPAGRVVSTYAAQLGPGTNYRGRSFERVSPRAEGPLAFLPSTSVIPGVAPNAATPGLPAAVE